MIVQLRPYQQYFEDEFFKCVKNGVRNVCIGAFTGCGKTYMSASIAEKYLNDGGIVIFIAPRIDLVKQTVRSFDHLGRVQIIQGNRKFDNNGYIYIASMQTLIKRTLLFTPALIIHDERHFAFYGKTGKKILDKFPNADYLSLTATPYTPKGFPLKGFDKIIHYKTIQWYIDNEYLVDCECYAPVLPDLSNIKTTAGDYNNKELDAVMNNSVMIGNILEETVDRIRGKKTLFFAVTIDHCEEVAKQYGDAGFNAVAYHSKLNDDIREKIIEDFENGIIDILVSVSTLTMGFDVPNVNCIIIARPTKSQNLYRQIVGRGMRPFPGKDYCLLIDCAGVIKENGMPNEEVVPKEKKRKPPKLMKCHECGNNAKQISRSIKKIKGVLNYVTTWACKNNHTFETEKEVGVTTCPVCSLVIISGRAKFEEQDNEYIVYTNCDCGEKIIIRTIPKIKGKLEKIESNKITILDLVNKIGKLTSDDQREFINKFVKYIFDIIHPEMHQQCLSSIYVSLSMRIPNKEIESNLMQAVVDSSLRKNKFKCLSPKLIRIAYKQTKDPANIIHMHNSRAVNPMGSAFTTKTINKLREFEDDFPNSKRWLLKTVKTRCKNIQERKQKIASIFYFFDMLREKEEETTSSASDYGF